MSSALDSVLAERQRQDAKWGEQNHDLPLWITVLMEEVGEFAQTALHNQAAIHGIDRANRLQTEIQGLSGPFIDRIIKKEWPAEIGDQLSIMTYARQEPTPTVPSPQFTSTLRQYRLQHTAIESPSTSDVEMDCACLRTNVQTTLESYCCDQTLKYIENRRLVPEDEEITATDPIDLDFAPRTNWRGRKIFPWVQKNGKLYINRKYERCPRQVLDFHPDSVHFLFPKLEEWAGRCQYLDKPPRFRVVMTLAARPVHTELGTLYTLIPRGLRGWLYRVAWKLLNIKP